MLTERAFDAGAVSLNYAEGPAVGPPLVLLHGATVRWQNFLPIIPFLGWRWHLYAPDFRGHGRSGRGAYRIADYAQDTARFLREVVREPAVLVGWSLGATVAVQVAAELPEAVRAVVLGDPADPNLPAVLPGGGIQAVCSALRDLLRAGHTRDELIAVMARTQPGTNAAALRANATAYLQLDPDVLTSFIDGRVWDGYDHDALLARIGCPALLLQADPAAGGIIPDAMAEHAAALLADGALVRLPGVGHHSKFIPPEVFVPVVTDFLESLRAEAPLAS